MDVHNSVIPIVIEKTGQIERSYDIYSRLLKERIIFIGSAISDEVANVVIAQLLFLQFREKNKDISMYLNTPGGSVTAGLAIYDTMQYVTSPIATYCIGQASSMGAILLSGGTQGKRHALPHSRIMIHQPWGGASGTAKDIEIQAEEIVKHKLTLNKILAKHTGQDLAVIEKDSDRDFYMSPHEAKEYGLVDVVLEPRDPTSK